MTPRSPFEEDGEGHLRADQSEDPRPTRGPRLFGRTRQIADIRAFFSDTYRPSAAMVIEGLPWTGRTALIGLAARTAAEKGALAIRAEASRLDRSRPWGVAERLLDSGGWHRPVPAPPDVPGSAYGERLCAEFDRIRDGRTLALIIDDAQWCDPESASVLSDLVCRSRTPVRLVLADHSRHLAPRPAAFDNLRSLPLARLVRTGPLGGESVRHLLESCLGWTPDQHTSSWVYEVTAGNPKLIIELARALASSADDGGQAAAELMPDGLIRTVTDRLSAIEQVPISQLLAALEAISILGDAATVANCARHIRTDVDVTARILDLMTADGLLIGEQPVRFVHRVVGAAVLREMGRSRRSLAHLEAARLLYEVGSDTEVVTDHLLQSECAADPWAAARLETAGREARSRGAEDRALFLFSKALAAAPLTAGPSLLLELSRSSIASDPKASSRHLRRAIEMGADSAAAARTALDILRLGGEPAAGDVTVRLRDVSERLEESHSDLRTRLLAALAELTGDDAERSWVLQTLNGMALESDLRGSPGGRLVCALRASRMLEAEPGAPAEEVARLARSGLLAIDLAQASWSEARILCRGLSTLVFCGRTADADTLVQGALDLAVPAADPTALSELLLVRGSSHLVQGRLDQAESDMWTVTHSVDPGTDRTAMAVDGLVHTLVIQGRVVEARSLFVRLTRGRRLEDLSLRSHDALLEAEARLLIGEKRFEEAHLRLEALRRSYDERGAVGASSVRWRAPLTAVLVSGGQLEVARTVASDTLALARAFGAPWLIGVALLGFAQTSTGDERTSALREAVEVLESSPAVVVRATALVRLGSHVRHDRGAQGESRALLRKGADLAFRHGLTPLVEAALEELRMTGARPRRIALAGRQALTSSEQRIVTMAADGLTNAEIAARLYIAQKTVEGHLARAYRKLGITSRSDLNSVEHLSDPGRAGRLPG